MNAHLELFVSDKKGSGYINFRHVEYMTFIASALMFLIMSLVISPDFNELQSKNANIFWKLSAIKSILGWLFILVCVPITIWIFYDQFIRD